MNRPVKEEYAMLREEIMECMRDQNHLSTFASATTCTYIGAVIALKNPNPFLYLLPFIILIPASFKISKYQCRVAYLASYLIVFLEGKDSFLWETRYNRFSADDTQQKTNIRTFLETMEFTILGCLCYVLCLLNHPFQFLQDSEFGESSILLMKHLTLIGPLLLIVVIACNMINYQNFRSAIQKNVKKWQAYKCKEYSHAGRLSIRR